MPAGIGIREDINKITNNTSSFVPHYIRNEKPSLINQLV